MKKKFHIYLILIPCISVLFSSCAKIELFEKNVAIPGHKWHWNFTPEINFSITDSLSAYDVFVIVRHTEAYEYRNLWLFVSTKLPEDTIFRKERFELLLQSPSGKWLSASNMDDIWEHRLLLFKGIQFKKTGTYRIQLEQNMRDNPLKHIMNAGIRIQKSH